MYDFQNYDLSGINVDDLRDRFESVKIPFFTRLVILFTGRFPMPELDFKSIDLSNPFSKEC